MSCAVHAYHQTGQVGLPPDYYWQRDPLARQRLAFAHDDAKWDIISCRDMAAVLGAVRSATCTVRLSVTRKAKTKQRGEQTLCLASSCSAHQALNPRWPRIVLDLYLFSEQDYSYIPRGSLLQQRRLDP